MIKTAFMALMIKSILSLNLIKMVSISQKNELNKSSDLCLKTIGLLMTATHDFQHVQVSIKQLKLLLPWFERFHVQQETYSWPDLIYNIQSSTIEYNICKLCMYSMDTMYSKHE